MRDDDASRHTTDSLPLAVMVQSDPMLEEHPARPARIIATLAGAAVIVALALYGMTRPAGQQEMAAAPSETQTAPAPSQNPQPSTTGQGAGEQAGKSKTPPASGGSATSAVGPGAKPAPEAR
jgi:hypothetical protein